MRPLRVLFVAEAVTLAHVVRLATLADSLHREGAEVCLASDPRYARFVGPLPYSTVALRSLAAEQFFRALSTGRRIYDFDTLDRYARDDLALFAQFRPDVVVGDFRLSLCASARHAGVPFVNLTNAYWSPNARVRQVVPEYDWVHGLGVGPAGLLFRAFRRLGFARHAAPVNRLRRAYGLGSMGSDFRRLLTDGDLTCFADSPLIVPVEPLLPSECFIGPVPWSPRVPLPSWWGAFTRDGRGEPLIFLNLGSSGPPGALQSLLDALAPMPVRVIATSAGQAVDCLQVPANARIAEMLPGDRACAISDLVVCNGGSPAAYQAFSAGVPVVGVATNMDQFLNMAAVEDAGCGILLRSRHLDVGAVRQAVGRGLAGQRLRVAAQRMQAALAQAPATTSFRAALARLLGR